MAFKRAVKSESKLRLALAGPAGSGKTYTALTLATALAAGKSVAVIDTERGSASKYADLFAFDVLELDSFHPDRYVEAVADAVAGGYGVVVVDSLSHAWNGHDGLLEQVEKIAARDRINTFQAWGKIKPIENRLVEALTGSAIHVIATMRSKTEYVVEQNERGKATPRKVGTAPIQRDGFEYEFDVFGELTADNDLLVQKTRCTALTGQVIHHPGRALAETLRAWLEGNPLIVTPAPHPTPKRDRREPEVGRETHETPTPIRQTAMLASVPVSESASESRGLYKRWLTLNPEGTPDLYAARFKAFVHKDGPPYTDEERGQWEGYIATLEQQAARAHEQHDLATVEVTPLGA